MIGVEADTNEVCTEMPEAGRVFWITGLSGAGKSTLACCLFQQLRKRVTNVVLIDGDAFRAVMGEDLGHHPEDRLRNAYRIARLCRLLSCQGLHVVCATMSLFHECRAWNRENLPGYFEVYLRVRRETLLARDPKGLYASALQGHLDNVVGVSLPFEEPQTPDLILDNDTPRTDFIAWAERILMQSGLA
jgi:adenylylsulfate kinase